MSTGALLTMVRVVETSAFTGIMLHLLFLLIVAKVFLRCRRHFTAEFDNGFQPCASKPDVRHFIEVHGNAVFLRECLLRDLEYLLCEFLCCHRYGAPSSSVLSMILPSGVMTSGLTSSHVS